MPPKHAFRYGERLSKTKATYIINITEVSHGNIVDLRNNKSYLIIDEVTDISTSSMYAILLKYFNKETKSIPIY